MVELHIMLDCPSVAPGRESEQFEILRIRECKGRRLSGIPIEDAR